MDPEHLHVRGHRGRGPGQLRGRQRRPPGGQGEERAVEPGRDHQLGHRVRGQEQARGLHQDIRVQEVDQQRDQLSNSEESEDQWTVIYTELMKVIIK